MMVSSEECILIRWSPCVHGLGIKPEGRQARTGAGFVRQRRPALGNRSGAAPSRDSTRQGGPADKRAGAGTDLELSLRDIDLPWRSGRGT